VLELPTVLVVDDVPQNIRLLEAILIPKGYDVVRANNGEEALAALAERLPDVVLLDIQMPGIDGYEVCRCIRESERTSFLPVIMITASGGQEKVKALEAGADDFVLKPFDHPELLARVKSLVRIKRFHDTVAQQAAELRTWADTLERRVAEQVDEIERMGRLRRFLSPELADMVLASGDGMLAPHRREIAVLFCDLRGFTAFSETAEPEEMMEVVGEYHEILGGLVKGYEATVGGFAGDGAMVYWNDPVPVDDPATRAVRFGADLCEQMVSVKARWNKLGHQLDVGVGVAQGYATLGMIGFEGRMDYTPLGTVMNMAARLCAEAKGGEVLVNQRACLAVDGQAQFEAVEPLILKGFSKPVAASRLLVRE
jgi:class 3 adenylate cyclase/CheY-like chemotaxis protein